MPGPQQLQLGLPHRDSSDCSVLHGQWGAMEGSRVSHGQSTAPEGSEEPVWGPTPVFCLPPTYIGSGQILVLSSLLPTARRATWSLLFHYTLRG